MKFGVIIFPGSNCDRDVIHVLQDVMKQEVKILWHKDSDLSSFTKEDCIVLPGGFSYGDYLRPGAIAQFSPIMEPVRSFAKEGGNIFGICNGFQILCEQDLLPGVLLRNHTQKFICRNVHLKTITNKSAVTSKLTDGQVIQIPIAHADGRYYADEQVLKELEENNQILFKYCDATGVIKDEANPNGAMQNIAGICNKERNVFGMMPHPERASEKELGNDDGKLLFESLLSFMNKN